ncbi:MAG TPA: ATP-binding protein [Allosphingosinicella sp.]|jgi:signal transduction histidine kinase
MKRPRPSLVRRLLLAFVIGPLLVFFVLILALRPALTHFPELNVGPEIAIVFLEEDIRNAPGGGLALRPDSRSIDFARRSPHSWFLVRQATREMSHGAVPGHVREMIRTLPQGIKEAHLGDAQASSRLGDVSITQVDTAAGRVTIYAGGIEPSAITTADWLAYAYLDAEFYLVVTLIIVICASGGPLAIPIVLRSLRPTARAAASIDPSELDKRIPEKRVVKELLPIVRAFNGALDRLAAGFERRRRFIADVAHELRTPLAVLNMHIDALPAGGGKADLQRTVYRLGQMVGQMLDSERLALAARRREPVDLVETARVAVADIAPLAVATGYELGLTADCDRLVVQGDPYAISRAIANLLGNAVAHGGGSGTISVHVARDGRVDVADEGPGLPVEARERIFEPFHRERWDRDGCGLGLHLVREIMHAHGGEARLVSSGPGSLFRLQFPGAAASG